MPIEGRQFRDVNIAWHKLMNDIHEQPAALEVIKIDHLGKTLKDASNKLEKV